MKRILYILISSVITISCSSNSNSPKAPAPNPSASPSQPASGTATPETSPVSNNSEPLDPIGIYQVAKVTCMTKLPASAGWIAADCSTEHGNVIEIGSKDGYSYSLIEKSSQDLINSLIFKKERVVSQRDGKKVITESSYSSDQNFWDYEKTVSVDAKEESTLAVHLSVAEERKSFDLIIVSRELKADKLEGSMITFELSK